MCGVFLLICPYIPALNKKYNFQTYQMLCNYYVQVVKSHHLVLPSKIQYRNKIVYNASLLLSR